MGANKFTHTCLVDTLSLSALKVPSLIYKGAIEWALILLLGLTYAHSIRLYIQTVAGHAFSADVVPEHSISGSYKFK